jgi:hypothetical protein
VPVGNVLVCDTGGKIEHDDTALSVDARKVKKKVGIRVSPLVPSFLNWYLIDGFRCAMHRIKSEKTNVTRNTY